MSSEEEKHLAENNENPEYHAEEKELKEYHPQPNRIIKSPFPPSNNNPALRLLDACFDDVGYARYLLKSSLPADRAIRGKVNWKDPSGVSILHLLAYSDLDKACQLLIKHNADVNITNNHDETPLHWCAKMNSLKCARVLIDAKAHLNPQDASGSTPLHHAVQANHLEIIVLLLDSGADVSKIDHEQTTPVELLADGKTNLSKAILVVFLRHYQKKGLTLPKRVVEKIGFTTPLSTDDIGSVINHKLLIQTLHQYMKENFENWTRRDDSHDNNDDRSRSTSPVPAHRSKNFRPFSGGDTSSMDFNDGTPTSVAEAQAHLQQMIAALPFPDLTKTQTTAAAPMTIYDQLKTSEGGSGRPARRGSFLGNSSTAGGSQVSGLDLSSTFQSVAGTVSRGGGGGRPNRRRSFLNGVPPTDNNNKKDGNGSVASPAPTGKARRRLSMFNNLPASASNSPPPPTPGANAANTSAMSVLSLLEEARKNPGSHNNKGNSNNPGNTSPGGQRPKFIVKKLDHLYDLNRADSNRSLRQLIHNMDNPRSGPSSPTGRSTSGNETGSGRDSPQRKARKNRKIAQSMSVLPTTTISIEEFISKNMKDGGEETPEMALQRALQRESRGFTRQKTLNALLATEDEINNQTTSTNNSPMKPRRHLSAPDILIPSDVEDLLTEEELKEATAPGGGTSNLIASGMLATPLTPGMTPRQTVGPNTGLDMFKIATAKTAAKQIVSNAPRVITAANASEKVFASALQQASSANLVELAFPPAEVVPFLPSPWVEPEDATTGLTAVHEEEGSTGSRHNQNNPFSYSPDHLDVIVAVEHCCDCNTHNDQSLRHNETKYVSMANAVLYSLIKALAQSKLAVRVYALRCKPLTEKRVGALEVTISVRVNLPELITEFPVVTMVPKQVPQTNREDNTTSASPYPAGRSTQFFTPGKPLAAKPSTNNLKDNTGGNDGSSSNNAVMEPVISMQQQRGQTKWITHRLFSKLETKSWPNFKTIEQRAINFVEVMMKDVLYGRKVLSTPSSNAPRPATFLFQPDQVDKTTTNTATANSHDLQHDIYHSYKYDKTPVVLAKEIQEQYEKWVERMRIPPQIIRDPLDMDWPTELLYVDYASDPILFAKYLESHPMNVDGSKTVLKHPPGPYLDIAQFAQFAPNRKEVFEKMVLQHFFVFDARFPQYEKLYQEVYQPQTERDD